LPHRAVGHIRFEKSRCGELRRAFKIRFADDKACANCAKNGFAENLDATSGKGLRDRAYTLDIQRVFDVGKEVSEVSCFALHGRQSRQ